MSFGSTMCPMTKCVITGRLTARRMSSESRPGLTMTTGRGMTVATSGPTEGMKLRTPGGGGAEGGRVWGGVRVAGRSGGTGPEGARAQGKTKGKRGGEPRNM